MGTLWSSFVQPPRVLWFSRRWRFPCEQADCWRRALRLPPTGTICEVGCGPGGLLTRIAETTIPPGRVIGVDRDAGMLAFARERVRELRLTGMEFLQADALALPLPDGCLDALTSYTLFEHIAGPDAFCRECRRVLRPGGALSVASTGSSFRVEGRLPQPPAELAREIARLEAIADPWREAIDRVAGVGCGAPLGDLPNVVRGWGLADFRVDSWSRTVCLDDARLSPEDRHDIVRDCCAVPPALPPAEADLRLALREAGAGPPDSPYLTDGQRRRLRELYDLRERLALQEADRQGAGPFYVTSVMLAASGVVA